MGSARAAPGTAGTICNPPGPSPSAVYIVSSNPTVSIRPGGVLYAHYDLGVRSYSARLLHHTIRVPSVLAVFPLRPSGAAYVYFPPTVYTIAGPGWFPPAASSTRVASGSTLTFAPGSSHLTTSMISVMATEPYGALTVKLRWHWNLTAPGHSPGHPVTQASAWTVPTRTPAAPGLPSIFLPAPQVNVGATAGASVRGGSTYWMHLTGFVSNTAWRTVVEYPANGTEIRSMITSSPPRVAFYNDTLPLTTRSGAAIPPGHYLIHVHDRCGAIVVTEPVTAT